MLAVPLPGAEEALANATYEALLWSLSRPGQLRSLPGTDPAQAHALIIASLLDRECSVFCADPLLMPLVARTGAMLTELPRAGFAFLGGHAELAMLDELACGSDLYPDDGATALLEVRHNGGQGLRLSGPGIDGAITVQIDGLPAGFWEKRRELIRYPMGFELYLIDGLQLMGLPRSTTVEVL
tara:strand:+ start:1216 stop:1764 length:549 start_codon:yes stop_codon:yes gene_type:complete